MGLALIDVLEKTTVSQEFLARTFLNHNEIYILPTDDALATIVNASILD